MFYGCGDRANASLYMVKVCGTSEPRIHCNYYKVSRESGEKKTKCGWIAPCTHSDGPVSQTCLLRLLRRELLRAVTLDDSTPQRRISELRVWSYEPFIVFAPSSSGYTRGQNLKVLYILITEIIKTHQEIMRFISRNWSNSWIMFLKGKFNSALTHT